MKPVPSATTELVIVVTVMSDAAVLAALALVPVEDPSAPLGWTLAYHRVFPDRVYAEARKGAADLPGPAQIDWLGVRAAEPAPAGLPSERWDFPPAVGTRCPHRVASLRGARNGPMGTSGPTGSAGGNARFRRLSPSQTCR